MRNIERTKEMFLKVIWSHLNTPYIWGGDDFSGFDCSGLAIEGLQAIGYFSLRSDATANGLWTRFQGKEVDRATAGCLLFWFNKESQAYHVAVAVDPEHCITADGGGSKTTSIEKAIEQNAYIKIRRIDHRNTYPRIVNIFQEE